MYTISGYQSYFNSRAVNASGGTIILVREKLVSRQLASDITANDAFNICLLAIGRGVNSTLIVCVNRAI